MPSTVGIVASGVFSPLDLSPVLWLDAADTTTITASSGSVSQWNDKSGNGRNFAQSTGAAQPTTGSVTVNGRNALSFDGGDELTHDAGSDAVVLAPLTFAMVAYDNNSAQGASDFRRLMSGRRSATGAADFQSPNFYFYKNATTREIKSVGAGNESPFASYTNQTPFVITGRLTSSEASIAVNAGSLASTAINAAIGNMRYLRLGATVLSTGNPPGTFAPTFWNGYICEVLFFNADLSEANRLVVRDYLRSKWGTA